MSIKIHIAVALIAAMSAVVILLLLVIAQNARSSAESLSSYRQSPPSWMSTEYSPG
jgi:hypothetical protein